jgi:hypothetical protein
MIKKAPPKAAKPAPRKGLTLHQALLASPPPRTPPAHHIELPKPMPGVVPEEHLSDALLANDSAIASSFDFFQRNVQAQDFFWPGFTFLSELAQRPEYRRISETIAKEMTRKWIRFHTNGDGDKSIRIKSITDEMRRLKIQDAFRVALEHDGLFGRSHIFLDVDVKNPADLETPLYISNRTIKKGAFKRVRVIEPIWTYPGQYNSTRPWDPTFYRPDTWWVMGTKFHSTRLPMIVSREVPDILKPAYMFGGLSMTQMIKPYVDNWLRTRQSVSDLVHAFSVSVLKTNMQATLAGEPGAGQDPIARAQMFNQFRDNRGLFMLDKETEEFANVATPLSTLDKLLAQSQEQMASIAGIPLTILLGITPSGLNASSDGEIRTFYAWIEALQNDVIRDLLARIIKIIQLSLWGNIDDEIDFSFIPLWTLDEEKKAAVRKTNADTAAVYIGQGVLSPDEERQRIAQEDDGIYNNLDLSAPLPEVAPPELGQNPMDDDEDEHPSEQDAPPKQQPVVGHGANDEWNESDHARAEKWGLDLASGRLISRNR